MGRDRGCDRHERPQDEKVTNFPVYCLHMCNYGKFVFQFDRNT